MGDSVCNIIELRHQRDNIIYKVSLGIKTSTYTLELL